MNFFTIIFFSLFLFLTACPSKNSDAPSTAVNEVIPVKGDPMVFIEGTARDTTSGIPINLLSDGSKWTGSLRGFMTQKQNDPLEDMEEAKNDNKAPEVSNIENIKNSLNEFKINLENPVEGELVKFSDETTENDTFSIQLKRSRNKFLFENIRFNSLPFYDFKNVAVEHYSIKNDRSAFSILISIVDQDMKYLLSLDFVKVQDKSILQTMLDTSFMYLYGPGIKIAWNQENTLEMLICDSNSSDLYFRHTKKAAKAWQDHLENRLNYSVGHSTVICPPFSDLNTQSIIHVNGWIEIHKEGMTAAFTLNLPDFYDQEFKDGDVFFLESEWEEALDSPFENTEVYTNDSIATQYKKTITHEVGHILGLHHMFDEGTDSIMGYSGVLEIEDYDINAIHELYPEINSIQ